MNRSFIRPLRVMGAILLFGVVWVQMVHATYTHNPFRQIPSVTYIPVTPSTHDDRFLGGLLGLAVGDMLGSPLEFLEKDTFSFDTPEEAFYRRALWSSDILTIFLDPYRAQSFNALGWRPGEWSDNTSNALCLVASLIERGFDLEDQLKRWIRWRDEGYMSYTRTAKDIGVSMTKILASYEKRPTQDLRQLGMINRHAFTQKLSQGNSPLVRVAPLVLWAASWETLAQMVQDHGGLTHGGAKTMESMGLLAMIQWRLIHHKGPLTREEKELILTFTSENLKEMGIRDREVTQVALSKGRRNWKIKTANQMNPSGFAIDTMECVLWAFYHHDSPQEALKSALLLGGEAATIGSIVGSLVGFAHGLSAFPKPWQENLWGYDTMVDMVQRILSKKSS